MVGVVEGVLGGLSVLHSGKVDAAPLEENQRKNMNGCSARWTASMLPLTWRPGAKHRGPPP